MSNIVDTDDEELLSIDGSIVSERDERPKDPVTPDQQPKKKRGRPKKTTVASSSSKRKNPKRDVGNGHDEDKEEDDFEKTFLKHVKDINKSVETITKRLEDKMNGFKNRLTTLETTVNSFQYQHPPAPAPAPAPPDKRVDELEERVENIDKLIEPLLAKAMRDSILKK